MQGKIISELKWIISLIYILHRSMIEHFKILSQEAILLSIIFF